MVETLRSLESVHGKKTGGFCLWGVYVTTKKTENKKLNGVTRMGLKIWLEMRQVWWVELSEKCTKEHQIVCGTSLTYPPPSTLWQNCQVWEFYESCDVGCKLHSTPWTSHFHLKGSWRNTDAQYGDMYHTEVLWLSRETSLSFQVRNRSAHE
jgi:hypothetical protein